MRFLSYLFSFSGRFRRTDYWLCQLLQLALFFVLAIVLGLAMEAMGKKDIEDSPLLMAFVWVFIVVYVISSIACHVKRWHDHGRSGWWQLVALIPFGGIYILVVCGFMRGEAGPNAYGPDPLAQA